MLFSALLWVSGTSLIDSCSSQPISAFLLDKDQANVNQSLPSTSAGVYPLNLTSIQPDPNPLLHALSGSNNNDYSFKIPDTDFRVTLYPDEWTQELDKAQASSCIRAMQNKLSLIDESKKVTKLREQIFTVEMAINSLPASDLKMTGYQLTIGDASKFCDAFAKYVKDNDFYYSMWFQISHKIEFIATGYLKSKRGQAVSPVDTF